MSDGDILEKLLTYGPVFARVCDCDQGLEDSTQDNKPYIKPVALFNGGINAEWNETNINFIFKSEISYGIVIILLIYLIQIPLMKVIGIM